MEKQALSRNVDELLRAVRLCRSNDLYVPALLIAYAGIDILASLDPPDAAPSTRENFIAWVEKYLLQNSDLPCDAIDLYAARCAVIHTFGPESGLTRKGEASRLVYAFGDSTADEIQGAINEVGTPDRDLAVHVDNVLDSFERAVWVFRRAILKDAELRTRVERNAHQFFSGVSYGHGFSILDIRMG